MYLKGDVSIDFLGVGKNVDYPELYIVIDDNSIYKMSDPASVYGLALAYDSPEMATQLSQIPVNLTGYAEATQSEIEEAMLNYVKDNIFTSVTLYE
ncbi:hypothetical protein [Rouxiella sp. WC2420]|uniref:Uncharacterized protein n=1 Tax=Rouxiella sp. WC2420 TaxID=3234145 RepID=A0AB39VL13_9GAMM